MNTIITFILAFFANIYKIQSSWFWEVIAILSMLLITTMFFYLHKKYKNKRNIKNSKGIKKTLHRIVKLILLTSGVVFLLGLSLHLLLLAYIVKNGGQLNDYYFDTKELEKTYNNVEIQDANGNAIYTITPNNENRKHTEKEEISEYLKEAIVATEDKTYYNHSGVSVKGYLRAIFYKIKDPSASMHGGSTITQQLIKNINRDMYGRTVVHKYQEALMAIVIERKHSKEEILEMYLNNIFLGSSNNGNLYGVGSASKYYFEKEPSELNISESAFLAGLAKAPSAYTTDLEKGNNRKNIVLELMRDYGSITDNQLMKEKEEKIKLIKNNNKNDRDFAAYSDYVIYEAENKFKIEKEEIFEKGYIIKTHINKDMQKNMKTAVSEMNFKDDKTKDDIVQVAMAAIDNDSRKIVGIYGGRNYEYGYKNRSYSKYQPGSIIKPLAVYAPALDLELWNAYSEIKDEETDFNGFKPKNATNKFIGKTTVEQSLIRSLNIPTVKILDDIGIDYGINSLSSLGIKVEEEDKGLHLALGGMEKGVTPIEMAQAYSTFSNYGYYEEANAIKTIETKDGKLIKKETDIEKRKSDVFTPKTVYHMTEMMKKVITDKNGTGNNAKINRPVAGKTGTAQEPLSKDEKGNRASWFVGYTPEFTLSVYTGFDKPSEQNYLTFGGGDIPAKIFKSVMTKQLKNYLHQDFKKPQNVTSLYDVKNLNGAKELKLKYNKEEKRMELTWETDDKFEGIEYKIYEENSKGEFVQIGRTDNTYFYDYNLDNKKKAYEELGGEWYQVASKLWDNTKKAYSNVVGESKKYYIIAEYNGVKSEKSDIEKKWLMKE